MQISINFLSTKTDNLLERFSKKCDNYNDFCECQKIKKESLIYNGFICDKYYSVKFDKKKDKFESTYKLCDGDLNIFLLLHRKRVFPF